jgi:hypothetical protein
MKLEVTKAIEEIRRRFPDSTVEVRETGDGGAHVRVDSVDLGPTYTEATRRTWIAFKIGHDYPFSDVYPHHVRRDLARADGGAHGQGFGQACAEGWATDSVQLSRRSNHRDATLETALLKLLKVLDWARRA